jgi:uncharacterized protein (DUF697 family)
VSLEIERYQSTTVTIDVPLENDGRAERDRATQLTTRAALTCAAISAEPIPWLDTALVLPIQIKLVIDIGRAYGFTLTRARARSVALELGGAFIYGYASRQFARGIAKITMPVVGGLVTAPVVYATAFQRGQQRMGRFALERRQETRGTIDSTRFKAGARGFRTLPVHDASSVTPRNFAPFV